MHIKQKRLPRLLTKVGVSLFFLLNIFGCEWGDRTISLIKPDTDELQVIYSDTVTVALSTVLKDSLNTTFSSGASLLVGHYADNVTGKIEAQPHALMRLASMMSIDAKAIYDSIVFRSAYSYYYGDTTKTMGLRLHPMTEDITRNTYYNISPSNYDRETVLGEKVFRPRPNGPRKEFRMTLSDDFGQKMFEAAQTNNLRSQEDLMNIIKGLTLVSDVEQSETFIGLHSDSTRVTLYYHLDGYDGITKMSESITLEKGFNRISNNREGSYLSDLKQSRVPVPYAAAQNHAVVQGGAGLMTRIDFPYLHTLNVDNGKLLVNRAYLKIKLPAADVSPMRAVPRALGLYATGRNNIWETSATPIATAMYTHDLYNNERYYQFDLSDYVVQNVSSGSLTTTGFLLAPMTGSNASAVGLSIVNSVDQLVLDGRKPVELQLYFTQLNYSGN